MKHTLFAILLLCLSAGATFAQDLPNPVFERTLPFSYTSYDGCNLCGHFETAPDTSLWIYEGTDGKLHRYGYSGAELAATATLGSVFIHGFAVTADSLLVFATSDSPGNDSPRLQVYDPRGALLRTIGLGLVPGTVEVGPDGTVWVATLGAGPTQLANYDPRSGAFRDSFMVSGFGVLVNDNNELLTRYQVSSTVIGIHRYTADGTSIGTFSITLGSQSFRLDALRHSGTIMAFPSPVPTSGSAYAICLSQDGTPVDTMVVGSGRGVDWVAVDEECRILVSRAGTISSYLADLDADGICDDWEVLGQQVGTGVSNWKPDPASPSHKNVYVEYDAMAGCVPLRAGLNRVVWQLAHIPNGHLTPPNPDAADGIVLLIDSTSIDTSITRTAFSTNPWTLFDSIRDSAFAKGRPQAEQRARGRVYRYVVFGDRWPATKRSGAGRGIPGFEAFTAIGEIYTGGSFTGSRIDAESGTFMHELGHILGLKHGGSDDINYKPNYKSVMNYMWQFRKPGIAQSWRLEYSPRAYDTLAEAFLDEPPGIGGEPGDSVFIGPHRSRAPLYLRPCIDPITGLQRVSATGAIDYNCDGDTTDAGGTSVARNLNRIRTDDRNNNADALDGAEDAPLIKLLTRVAANRVHEYFRQTAQPGALGMTEAEMAPAVALLRDCNSNGLPDANEILTGAASDKDCDWVIDGCESGRARPLRPLAVPCPGGDADTVGVRIDLSGTCDGAAVIDSGWACITRGVSSSGDVTLFDRRNGIWVPTDTLYAIRADTVAELVTLGTVRASGCGTVVFHVVVNGRQYPDSVTVEVRGLDLDDRVVGAVDRFDSARILDLYGGSGCGDVDSSGVVDSADLGCIDSHRAHSVPRKVITPNGGEHFAWGEMTELHWARGYGDSSLVTFDVIRDGSPGYTQEIGRNLVDDGAETWPTYVNNAPQSDFRIRIRHTAGLLASGREVGRDSSDAGFTVDEAQGGGGCPVVDAETPFGWFEENTVLGRSETGEFAQDAYLLRWASPLENVLRLRIRENEEELTTLDEVRVVGIDHRADVRAFVSGERFILGTKKPSTRVSRADGTDVTARFAGAEGYPASAGETLYVDLSPQTAADPTRPLDALGGGGPFEYDGGGKGGPAPQTISRPVSAREVDADVLENTGVLIQVPGGTQGWETVAHHYPREHRSEAVFDAIREPQIRLVCLSAQSVYFIGQVEEAPDTVVASTLTLLEAAHSRLGNVTGEVRAAGGGTTEISQGDTLTFALSQPATPEGLVRDYFLLSSGVYTANLRARQQPVAVPLRFALLQNRPNPFSITTTIRFDLATSAAVTLEVFDAQGRRVRELLKHALPAGEHSVDWDRRDSRGNIVRPGVYLYRMQAGSFRDLKKLVVLP